MDFLVMAAGCVHRRVRKTVNAVADAEVILRAICIDHTCYHSAYSVLLSQGQ